MSVSGIRAGRVYVELSADESRLVQALRSAEFAGLRMGAQLVNATKPARQAYRNLVQEVSKVGDAMKSVGRNMMGIAAAGAVAAGAGLKAFATFEQRMSRVQALTNASSRDMDRLREMAEKLGASTVYSASQAAEAMSYFALAGFDTNKILESLPATLDMAAAGQLEVAEATDIAAKIMAGMGVESKDFAHVADVMAAAMTTANVNLQQLGESMKYVGPVAANAGLQLEEVVASVQILGNAGIQADMAGTSLRAMLLSLTSPSKEAAEHLEALGVSIADAAGNVRPLHDIIAQLEVGLAGMGSADRLNALGQIFTDRSLAGVSAYLAKGSSTIREFTAALEDSGGTAARIASVQLNNLGGTLVVLRSAAEGLGIAIGDAIHAPLRVFAGLASQVTQRLIEWVKANRGTVVAVTAAVAGLGAIGTALFTAGVAVKAFGIAWTAVSAAISVANGVMAASTALVAAIASPLGVVTAAVVGLGAAVVTHFGYIGQLTSWLGERFKELSGFVGDVMNGMRDALAAGNMNDAAKILWQSLQVAWLEGSAKLETVWNNLGVTMTKATTATTSGMRSLFEDLWHGATKLGIDAAGGVAKAWNSFFDGLQSAWRAVIDLATEAAIGFRSLVDDDYDGLGEMALHKQGQAARKKSAEGKGDDKDEAVDAWRKRMHAGNDKLHAAIVGDLGESLDAALEAADAKRVGISPETQSELAKAKAELAGLIEKAKESRSNFSGGNAPATPGMPPMPSPQQQIKEAAAQLAAETSRMNRTSTAGTFSPQIVAQLGHQTVQERIAKAAEKTAQNTSQLLNGIGGSGFGPLPAWGGGGFL